MHAQTHACMHKKYILKSISVSKENIQKHSNDEVSPMTVTHFQKYMKWEHQFPATLVVRLIWKRTGWSLFQHLPASFGSQHRIEQIRRMIAANKITKHDILVNSVFTKEYMVNGIPKLIFMFLFTFRIYIKKKKKKRAWHG